MNLHKIIGLADPTGDKDGANKEYVDGIAGGGGDVSGPDSSVGNAVVLFDGITGKLIKDSARLILDVMAGTGNNIPDEAAIKTYGDTHWCEGSGDVSGPATNTDNYVPQWNGADSKLLKNGFAITAAGKALVDDADAAAQRVTLGLLSAALRDAEDALTDGANLPDGHAIKTYGDANWGGGYTNLTEFIAQTAFRVFYSNTDGDVTELALGADGTYLKSNGPVVNPSFEVPGGGGDVVGPAGAIDNSLPLFDGSSGKLIKNSTRLIEDTMTDGGNVPDGHAVKTYGDTNWGGSSSLWTDHTTHISPTETRDVAVEGSKRLLMSGGVYNLTAGGTELRLLTPSSTVIPAWSQGCSRQCLMSMFATKTDETQKCLIQMHMIQRSGAGARASTGLLAVHYSQPDDGNEVSAICATETGGGNAISCYKLHNLRPSGYENYESSGGQAFECATTDQSQAAFFGSGLQGWGAHNNASNCIVCQIGNSVSKGICITPEDNGTNFDTRQAFAIGCRTINQATDSDRTLWANLNGDLYLRHLYINTNNMAMRFKDSAGAYKDMFTLCADNVFVIGAGLASGHLKLNIDGGLKLLSIDANGFVKAA